MEIESRLLTLILRVEVRRAWSSKNMRMMIPKNVEMIGTP